MTSDTPDTPGTPVADFYEDRAGEWRWKLVGANGEIQASGEGYDSEGNARRGFSAVARNAPLAKSNVIDTEEADALGYLPGSADVPNVEG